MYIRCRHRTNLYRPALCLLILLWIIGCSGLTPYQPRNHREEGPERGVFTGSKGELAIPLPGDRTPENMPAQPTPVQTPVSE